MERREGLASTNMLLCRAERKTWQKERCKKRPWRLAGFLEPCDALAAVWGLLQNCGVGGFV